MNRKIRKMVKVIERRGGVVRWNESLPAEVMESSSSLTYLHVPTAAQHRRGRSPASQSIKCSPAPLSMATRPLISLRLFTSAADGNQIPLPTIRAVDTSQRQRRRLAAVVDEACCGVLRARSLANGLTT